jgi:hypothetical protein
VLLTPTTGIAVGKRVRVYNPKREKWGEFAPSMVFPYYRDDGSALGYVLRHDLEDGGKETPMVCRVRLPDGTECWSRFPFPRPRPLYHHEKLKPGQVVVVEGEKCADAMVQGALRQAVSWAGGTFGVAHTDWTPLAGRKVVIWPDADAPGIKTAGEVAAILRDLGCSVKVLDVSGDLPKGFDVADAVRDGWTKAKIDEFMKTRAAVDAPQPAPVAAKPVVQARTTEQAQPATVTHIKTRRTVAADDGWQVELVTDDTGGPKPGVAKNWALFLENHPKMRGVLAFDAFKMNVMLMRCRRWRKNISSTG